MLEDTFFIEKFFTEDEIQFLESNLDSKIIEDYPPAGTFANQLVAHYSNLIHSDESKDLLRDKLLPYCGDILDKNIFSISSLFKTTLFLPWGIHSDLKSRFVESGYVPYYNFIIPLSNVDSKTIIFDQIADQDNFFAYKEDHETIENPIPEDFWMENLSMCDDVDRFYLTLKSQMPQQKREQIQGFHRKFLHSSDNFSKKGITEKSFISLRIDTKISR